MNAANGKAPSRNFPWLAIVIVTAAIATMIGLGIWQLQRADWKNALLAQYANAGDQASVPFPVTPEDVENSLYRPSRLTCDQVLTLGAGAGRNLAGETGWAQIATCAMPGGATVEVVLGWANQPNALASWDGGEIAGTIGPGRDGAARLIADPPLAGLQANAAPDPNDLPNNHLGYAYQWFFFALTALVIFGLALRKRWLAPDSTSD